jgi:hypothetical protein
MRPLQQEILIMPTMTFGRRERVQFSADGPLNRWQPPVVPAIFAITYKQDPTGRPKSHTVLYFGECDNLAAQAPTIHKDFSEWSREYSDGAELYVFSHQMPGSSKYDRAKLAHQLVVEYDPKANN